MKVMVRLNNGREFAYEAPGDVPIGATVEVPKPFFLPSDYPNPRGVIVASGDGGYTGELRRIVRVLPSAQESD